MNTALDALEFSSVIEKLAACAVSDQAQAILHNLTPYNNETICQSKMAETTAARQVLDALGAPPLAVMKGLPEILTLSQIGTMLTPEQLISIALFAAACKRMIAYLRRTETHSLALSSYGSGIHPLESLQQQIESSVDDEHVFDDASPELRRLRRKMEFTEGRIKDKLNQIMQSRKQYLAEGYITKRNGRSVLPVQKRYQNQFGGTVVDTSASGNTVFMEPHSVADLQAELNALSIEEDAEVRRILYTLSAEVAQQSETIQQNMTLMVSLDVLFAKAKFSAAIHAGPVQIGGQRQLHILNGRHPLLDPNLCVPLDFELIAPNSGVIITGPNTGGKTVALKTVGLLSLMAQCGLHIPCAPNSYIAMQDAYCCDIGDSQSLTQNLSTFSDHMNNVIRILAQASRDSLVLLDELGSGTDPAEGMGIAIAVLEELRQRGCMFLVTTHYPQVKVYASTADNVQSARMAFDPDTLAPLYRLEMGKSGESCALHIAKRLGFPQHLLARAYHEVYGGSEPVPADTRATPQPKSKLVRAIIRKEENDPAGKFTMGDSVIVLPSRETGIVYRPADDQGDVIVQMKGVKQTVRHTRVLLRVPAAELYPPDYDFSVIFDTVENRKASRILSKRYDPTVRITRNADEIF